MISLIGEEEEQTYTYDRRGNLTAVSRGEGLLKAFTFDAANRMTGALQIKDGVEKRAEYRYNALGNRIGQDIYSRETDGGVPDINTKGPQDPEQQIRYTLDLTRQYHNLLISEDTAGQKKQTFYWDGNVAAMEETGQASYYLQDDLGSPMLLADEEGEIRESYAFDEFGQSLHHTPQGQLQPLGYTGYQMETVGGLYFAQARRYDARTGRFVSEDKIPGFAALPHTMNRYSYCWNQPMEHVDLDGRFPWYIVPPIIDIYIAIESIVCSIVQQEIDKINYPMPEPSDHEYKHTADIYNSDEYVGRTNCYAYAFDIVENPITGESFYFLGDTWLSQGELPFAAQPGLFSNQYNPDDDSVVSGTEVGNQKLVELVKADARAMGLNFQEYEFGMSGGYAVLLVVSPEKEDYHWYRQETDGTWSHKMGTRTVITGVKDPIKDAKKNEYTTIVGYYYIKEACDDN